MGNSSLAGLVKYNLASKDSPLNGGASRFLGWFLLLSRVKGTSVRSALSHPSLKSLRMFEG